MQSTVKYLKWFILFNPFSEADPDNKVLYLNVEEKNDWVAAGSN